jgi:hypothetical protein
VCPDKTTRNGRPTIGCAGDSARYMWPRGSAALREGHRRSPMQAPKSTRKAPKRIRGKDSGQARPTTDGTHAGDRREPRMRFAATKRDREKVSRLQRGTANEIRGYKEGPAKEFRGYKEGPANEIRGYKRGPRMRFAATKRRARREVRRASRISKGRAVRRVPPRPAPGKRRRRQSPPQSWTAARRRSG